VTNNYLSLIVQFFDQILYNQSITRNMDYFKFECEGLIIIVSGKIFIIAVEF
jgi:hypothetical protein